MNHILRTSLASIALVLAASAQAQVINISAASAVGTTVSLAAGDYTLRYTNAGTFAAWNPWGANAASGCNAGGVCSSQGWFDGFNVQAGANTYVFSSGTGFFSSSALALADATSTTMFESINGGSAAAVGSFATLHLDTATNVKFYISDSIYSDNAGGVSVTLAAVAPVPEPSTYALLLAGLGGVGFVARRRRA